MRLKREDITTYKASHDEQPDLCKVAKTGGKYTRDFSHMMFSGEPAFEKGWIVACKCDNVMAGASLPPLATPPYLGLYCVRHKVRTPVTELYFITVDPSAQGSAVAECLLDFMKMDSPHHLIELNCMKDNPRALRFYEKHGFKIIGESLKGKGHRLQLEF